MLYICYSSSYWGLGWGLWLCGLIFALHKVPQRNFPVWAFAVVVSLNNCVWWLSSFQQPSCSCCRPGVLWRGDGASWNPRSSWPLCLLQVRLRRLLQVRHCLGCHHQDWSLQKLFHQFMTWLMCSSLPSCSHNVPYTFDLFCILSTRWSNLLQICVLMLIMLMIPCFTILLWSTTRSFWKCGLNYCDICGNVFVWNINNILILWDQNWRQC